MSTSNCCRCAPTNLIWLVLVTLLIDVSASAKPSDAKFEVLRTKTGDYTNVTVTTMTDTFICIFHSRGMGSIQVADLPPEVLEELGYKVESSERPAKQASVWAQKTLSNVTQRVNLSEVKGLETALGGHSAAEISRAIADPMVLFGALAISLFCYLFFCYCGKLICEKTGNEPGFLIWLPILQLLPLIRAASMSSGWFLAFLIPGLNFVAHVVWCIKITQARGKSGWVAVMLLLPVTSLFAYLYLAFSSAKPPEIERGPEIMTLQTA